MARGKRREVAIEIEDKAEIQDMVEETIDDLDEISFKREDESPAELETPGPETSKNGIVFNAPHVRIRSNPDYESSVIDVLDCGEPLKIHENLGEFSKISTSRYSNVYIASKFIKEV